MLPKLSVNKPMTIVVAIILVVILGYLSCINTGVDLLPDMEMPYVLVMTVSQGSSPEEVESRITAPLEASLGLLSGLKNMSSSSSEGVSMLIMEFQQQADMSSIMVEMSSLVNSAAAAFPENTASPVFIRLNPSMLPVMMLTASREGDTPAEFSAYVEDTLIPAFQRLDGVANVEAMGLITTQAELVWDEEALENYNDLILEEVDNQLAQAKRRLDSAKKELSQQREALDEKSSELYDQLAQAGNQLVSGRVQLEIGQSQLDAAPDELKAQREQLVATRDAILTVLDAFDAKEEINQALDVVNSTLYTLSKAEDAISMEFGSISAARRSIQQQKSDLDAAYAAYNEALFTGNREDIEAAAAELTAENNASAILIGRIAKLLPEDYRPAIDIAALPEDPAAAYLILSAALTGCDNSLAFLNTAINNAEAARNELENQESWLDFSELGQMTKAEAEKYLDQIEDGIEQIDKALLIDIPQAQQQLEESRRELDKGSLELERGKLEASTQLSSAGVQLALGEAQLEAAYDEFYAARDTAFKNAGLDGALTPALLSTILGAEHFSMPAGYIEDNEQNILLKVGDKFTSLEEMQDLTLLDLDLADIGQIKVRDVTDLQITDNSGESYAMVNGSPGLILSIQKQSLSSTAEVSENLNEAIEELMANTPGLNLTPVYDQGYYIDVALSAVLDNLLLGAVLAILVLFLFLRNYRPTLIVALSIPISLLFALTLMYFSGVSINVISLAGLAMGVGMLVDNSIVVIENIYRLRSEGMPAREAAIKGARQVTGAIVSSTLTTACVFLPVVFTHGLTRELFADMGLTVAYSLLASLLVALTLIPAASSNLLNKPTAETPFYRRLAEKYTALLQKNLNRKWPLMTAAGVVIVFCLVCTFLMGTGFIPEVDYAQLTITMKAQDKDTPDQEIQELSNQVLDRILTLDYVDMAAAYDAGAMSMGTLMGTLMGSEGDINMYILLDPDSGVPSARAAAAIKDLTADMPVELEIESSGADMSAMIGSGAQINIKGDDLDTLTAAAGEIAGLIGGIEGFTNIDDGCGEPQPELRVTVDKNMAMSYGLTVAQVYIQLAGELNSSQQVITINTEDGEYPVIISRDPQSTLTGEKLADYSFQVEVPSVDGGEPEEKTVYLSSIATISRQDGLASINHQNSSRYLQVTAEAAEGYNLGIISRELEKELANYDPPAGVNIELAGENKEITDMLGDALLMIILACAFIYLIMVAQFQSLLLPFIIIFTIPLAFSGGLFVLIACGQEITIVAMLGFLLLAGIVVNNGIIFIDRVNQLLAEGTDPRQALILTGRQRLRPILMTALTTICSLLSLVFSQQMGAELLRPMAIVAAGGLVYATILTLFLVPSLYEILYRSGQKRKARRSRKKNGICDEIELEDESGAKLLLTE